MINRRSIRRIIPLVQVLLLIPSSLFMLSLFLRAVPPADSTVVQAAQQVVTWFSGRIWTLWILLAFLPLMALLLGGTTLVFVRDGRADPTAEAFPLIAGLTLVAWVILVIVGVHVLMN